jgi:nucleoside-diphosphate-sugar epimerase
VLKVAILGASGFIGSRVVEMFHLEEMAEVRPVVRRVSSMARPSRFKLDCRVADGFDRKALTVAFTGCEVVVHAVAGDPAVILGALAPVYEAAQEAGVRRLVYLSTASVHGQAPEPGTTERSALSDHQAIEYNNAKVQAERRLRRLRARGAVELVLLRPGIVFGPRSQWVASFADALLEGTAYLIDGGRGICNSIYVDNLVYAIGEAMTAPEADREAFLLGDRERVTWADLYRPIATALGFDLASIPDAAVPPRTSSLRELATRARASKAARRVSSMLPKRVRRAVAAAVRPLEKGTPPPSPWVSPSPRHPVATLEMALLYRCAYKLPFDKAARLLRYEPRVSFELACRRTIAWLAFAGYPVTNAAGRLT